MSRTSNDFLRRIKNLLPLPAFYSQRSNPVLHSDVHISKGLSQAYQLQDFCFEAALALKQALSKDGKLTVAREDSQSIKNIVSSWRDCQERVSFHRRVPPVKAVEAPGPKRKSRGAQVVPMPRDPPCEPEPPTEANGSAG